MKKSTRKKQPEMRPEYDFAVGVRGAYAHRYAQGANVVVLDPDVVQVFPNAEAVNSSLRALAEIIRRRSPAAEKYPFSSSSVLSLRPPNPISAGRISGCQLFQRSSVL